MSKIIIHRVQDATDRNLYQRTDIINNKEEFFKWDNDSVFQKNTGNKLDINFRKTIQLLKSYKLLEYKE